MELLAVNLSLSNENAESFPIAEYLIITFNGISSPHVTWFNFPANTLLLDS